MNSKLEQQRVAFYFSKFGKCPLCARNQFSRYNMTKNNEDTCGKEVFTCMAVSCRWSAEFLWSKTCENYYTEPALLDWKKPEEQVVDSTVRLIKRPYVYTNKPVCKDIRVKLIKVDQHSSEHIISKNVLGKRNKRESNLSADESIRGTAEKQTTDKSDISNVSYFNFNSSSKVLKFDVKFSALETLVYATKFIN